MNENEIKKALAGAELDIAYIELDIAYKAAEAAEAAEATALDTVVIELAEEKKTRGKNKKFVKQKKCIKVIDIWKAAKGVLDEAVNVWKATAEKYTTTLKKFVEVSFKNGLTEEDMKELVEKEVEATELVEKIKKIQIERSKDGTKKNVQ